jgi:hypothetical protein
LKTDQVKRMKELEAENARLRRTVSNLTLDKMISRRLQRETSEPRASPSLHRRCLIRVESGPSEGSAGCSDSTVRRSAAYRRGKMTKNG